MMVVAIVIVVMVVVMVMMMVVMVMMMVAMVMMMVAIIRCDMVRYSVRCLSQFAITTKSIIDFIYEIINDDTYYY